ncbi:MAG: hypothetical protein ABIK68_11015 [bacterium]
MNPKNCRHLLILFGTLFLLTTCKEAPEPDITGQFGSGSGGTTVSGAQNRRNITKTSGEVIATYAYDAAYFVEIYSAAVSTDPIFLALADIQGEGLSLVISRIYGRPDTACRYVAALLARDEGFEIDLTGERENTLGIAFYQVEVHKGSDYRGLFCAELKDDIGVSLAVRATARAMLASEQIYFILNSLTL